MRVAAVLVLLLSVLIPLPVCGQTAYLVQDIDHLERFGPGSSDPRPLLALPGRVLFSAVEPSSGREAWATDGTPQGSQMLVDACPGTCDSSPEVVGVANNLAFFTAGFDEEGNPRVWRSDGTRRGTLPLTSGGVGLAVDVSPARAATLGKTLFFSGCAGEEVCGLWKTDGTEAGTGLVRELGSPFGSDVQSIAVSGNRLFFLASDDFFESHSNLWTSDGTEGGTVQVKTIDGFAHELVIAGGRAFFFGVSEELGAELWTSDGTEAGTRSLTQFPKDPGFRWLKTLGNKVYFIADDVIHGTELWTSDGTTAGTVMVKDILPGPETSQISDLTAAAGRVWFSANDGVHGFELWVSDGTAAGTRLVQDLAPLGASSFPAEPTAVGDRLLWSADDGLTGRELWALPLGGPTGCQPSPTALCLGGRFRVEAVWRDPSANTGPGHAVALTADTGYFWFFNAANVEVVIKALDARTVNGHFWVFYGALSNVEYTLTVTDVQTGLTRRYFNPAGRFASVADTQGFGPLGAYSTTLTASAGPATSSAERHLVGAKAPCVESSTRLCLNGGRFAVEAAWKIPGQSGAAKAVRLTGDTGYLWFFDAANVEVVLKVLDGRPVNGKFWIFAGALSDVEYTITVTDTATGKVKTYKNPKGRLASFGDLNAF